MRIRADGLAKLKSGRVVMVKRPINFTGSPPVWSITAGEFDESELTPIGKDLLPLITMQLLERGYYIDRDNEGWKIK